MSIAAFTLYIVYGLVGYVSAFLLIKKLSHLELLPL